MVMNMAKKQAKFEQAPLEQKSPKTIFYGYHETAAGTLLVWATHEGIFEAQFVDEKVEFDQYKKIDSVESQKFILEGTEFQVAVWRFVRALASGSVVTYEYIAQALGMPQAYRAVANALAANKIAYFIPCHRVLRKDGSLGGYRWGVERKFLLLSAENSTDSI